MSCTAQYHESESNHYHYHYHDDDDDVPNWVRDEWQLNSDIATLLAGLDEEEAQDALTVAGTHMNFASRTPAQRKEATFAFDQSDEFDSQQFGKECDNDDDG